MQLKQNLAFFLAMFPTALAASTPRLSKESPEEFKDIEARESSSPFYEVIFQTFVRQTASDPFKNCEIRGDMGVGFSSTSSDLHSVKINEDLPILKNFRSENEGRGHLLGEWHHTVQDHNQGGATIWWQTTVYEEGSAFLKNRVFLANLRNVTWPMAGQRSIYWKCTDRENSASGQTGYWIICYRYIGKGACGHGIDCF